jgi:hypothetical protein
LVLDADALNAIAADSALQTQLASRGKRGLPHVITPHPLEAARLLGLHSRCSGRPAGRGAELASRFGVVAVLKGSGTVIADAGMRTAGHQSDRQCPACNCRHRRRAGRHDRRRAGSAGRPSKQRTKPSGSTATSPTPGRPMRPR